MQSNMEVPVTIGFGNGDCAEQLWKNTTSTSTWGTTSIPITDLSKYKLIYIHTSTLSSVLIPVINGVGSIAYNNTVTGTGASTNLVNDRRQFTIDTINNQINVSDCERMTQGTGRTTLNTSLIPMYVYGIK